MKSFNAVFFAGLAPLILGACQSTPPALDYPTATAPRVWINPPPASGSTDPVGPLPATRHDDSSH